MQKAITQEIPAVVEAVAATRTAGVTTGGQQQLQQLRQLQPGSPFPTLLLVFCFLFFYYQKSLCDLEQVSAPLRSRLAVGSGLQEQGTRTGRPSFRDI